MSDVDKGQFGRHFWWMGAVALMLHFNLLLIGSALIFEPVYVQYDLDGTCRDLDEGLVLAVIQGNSTFALLTFMMSLLALIVLNLPGHARRARIWLLGGVGCLYFGTMLARNWRYDNGGNFSFGAFPIDIFSALYFGLPLLWSLVVLWIAFEWREVEPEGHKASVDLMILDGP